jgi:cell division protein FtsI (penicillin-binding protein 3)
MNQLLRNPVNGANGTAHRAKVDGFVVAGKTGTAQMVNPHGGYFQNRHVCSFVGFLPADDPRLLILVVLYDVGHGHFGGLYAAPVFSQIAAGAARDLNITPTAAEPDYDIASVFPLPAAKGGGRHQLAPVNAPDPGDSIPALTGSKSPTTPNFIGLSLRAALQVARRLGTMLEVSGDGYVVAQRPAAGAPLSRGSIKLTLGSVLADATPPAAAATRPAQRARSSRR